jgi:hypothetical protein
MSSGNVVTFTESSTSSPVIAISPGDIRFGPVMFISTMFSVAYACSEADASIVHWKLPLSFGTPL